MNVLLKKLGLALAAVVLFLAVAEGLARIKYSPKKIEYPGLFEYDKDKIYRLKASHTGKFGAKPVKTNSLGYRDAEITITKPEGTRRIVIVGDSIAFGDGVLVEETFSEILERQFNKHSAPYRFEVINTSVPGNSPFQEYFDLIRAARLEPDAIILQFTLNDVVEPFQVFKRFGGAGEDYHAVQDIPYFHFLFSQRSAFYLFLRDVWARVALREARASQLKMKAWEREGYQVGQLVYNPDAPLIQDAWQECIRQMDNMVTFCRDRGWGVVILYVPSSFQLRMPYELACPQQIVSRFAEERNIRFIDLLAGLHALREALPNPDDPEAIKLLWSTYFRDGNHLSENGHQWAADLLQPYLLEIPEISKGWKKQ